MFSSNLVQSPKSVDYISDGIEIVQPFILLEFAVPTVKSVKGDAQGPL